MSLAEEVREYLTYILQLPEDAIAKALMELNNYESRLQN